MEGKDILPVVVVGVSNNRSGEHGLTTSPIKHRPHSTTTTNDAIIMRRRRRQQLWWKCVKQMWLVMAYVAIGLCDEVVGPCLEDMKGEESGEGGGGGG